MTTKEGLETALAILQTQGWCKYVMGNADYQVCALGALRRAYEGHTDKEMAEARDMLEMCLEAAAEDYSLISFNDAQDDVEPVYALFREAIRRCS